MPDLSIIIPGANEYPQNAFTIQSLISELQGEVDFEIIYIDNYCDELKAQGKTPDRGLEYLSGIAQKSQPGIVRVLTYKDKLSHWNAKNVGIQSARAPILFFCDAHCLVANKSLVAMYHYYKKFHEELNGTLHLPIAYMLEKKGRELIYKLVSDVKTGAVHYSFTGYRPEKQVYQVPCMSTCGMMITKNLMVNHLGMWPKELGIYGGGENFANFTLAVLGKTINIFPTSYPLYHYAEKRGYHWTGNDWMRNRLIASFVHSGQAFTKRQMEAMRGRVPVKNQLYESVVYNNDLIERSAKVFNATKVSIEEFCAKWGQ